MFNPIATFDISVPTTTYAPYTAKKIALKISNMSGIEQSFNITINYRDAITNDPFSDTFVIDEFPNTAIFTTNHTGDIILDSVDSTYTGSGTCTAELKEYEYQGTEDSNYPNVVNAINTDTFNFQNLYFASYTKNNTFGAYLRHYGGNVGDVTRVYINGITNTGERVKEVVFLRDGQDQFVLDGYLMIISITTDPISVLGGGVVELRTNTTVDIGSVQQLGNTQIIANINNQIAMSYTLSDINSQILFLGAYDTDNLVDETITYIGAYNNGNNSITDNMIIKPSNGDSQIKLLLAPNIETLSQYFIGSYTGSNGYLQWGYIQLPILPVTNNAPYVYAGILNQSISEGNNYFNLQLSGQEAFKDPDGDVLTYTVQSENNYGDTSFINISGNQIILTPNNSHVGNKYNFTIRATDGGGLYAETSFTVQVTGGSQPQQDRFIGNTTTGLIAFIIEETPTHYKAIGWYDMATLSLQSIIEPTIELTGVNVIMSKDYISQNSGEFTVQTLN